MNKKLLIIPLLILAFLVNAQNSKKLDLEDVISGGKNYAQFRPEYKKYSFLGTSDIITRNSGDTIYKVSKGIESILVTKSKINVALSSHNIEESTLWNISWLSNSVLWNKVKGGLYAYNIESNNVEFVIKLDSDIKAYDFNEESRLLAYVLNDDLYISNSKNEHQLIIEAGADNRVIGQSVHRNEFGITNGLFWSNKGTKLAFYDMDESMVTDYPLVDITTRVATEKDIKYPMAGMKSHHVKVGVYDIATKEISYLSTGEPKEKYLTNVSWSFDDANILLAELNRGQNHMELVKYDASTGDKIAMLFDEKSTKWVEPENSAYSYSKDRFIWQSERDGYNHLYIYNTQGKLIKQLTKGDWVVTKFCGLDSNNKYAYFEGTKDGALDRNLYKVSLSSEKVTKLSSVSAYHSFSLSNSKNWAIDMYSNQNTPRVIGLLNTKNSKFTELFRAEDPYEGYGIGDVKLTSIKAADGKTDLNGRIILPPNFDASKKYPVVVYVYGGPHAQLVTNTWLGGARAWQLLMAQKGYIAFTMDNRGTPYRGTEFEQAIHRRLGEIEAADQMEGIKYLKSLPYVDSERIGVHGWSFGGFMTINLMEKFPDVFKVGVSGGPVTDWKYYEVMYGERYMDSPEENPEGYAKSNLNSRVESIEGRLLVIHGAIDPTVVWQHSLYFIEECIKKRVQIDYFVYPTHEHNVLGPDRVHLMEKVTRYFDDFL